MFKKALFAIGAIASSFGLAFANGGTFAPAPEAAHHVSGFYVGADISRDRGHYELNTTDKTDFSGEGINGGLFAGYGVTIMDHYYLGLEGFGDITSNKAHLSDSAGLNFENNWDAGIDFMPGVKVTDSTLLYGKIGYVNGEFKFTGIDEANTSKHLSGLQAGLGMEAMVTQNVGVRGEWVWNYYQHYKIDGVEVFNHPVVDQFKFGLDYHFNMA